ncbi:MAG: M13 family metallopeptidase [Terriglobia bacterium]
MRRTLMYVWAFILLLAAAVVVLLSSASGRMWAGSLGSRANLLLSWGVGTSTAGELSNGALDLKSIDPKVKACTDFYTYANEGWLSHNPIPPQYPSWGRFNELAIRNRKDLRAILEKAAADKSAASGSNEQKIGRYYASCMDQTARDTAGVKPLDPDFQKIEQIHDTPSLEAEIANLQKLGVNVLFRFSSSQDLKNSSEEIGDADQGGLGLPNRDYYTKQDAKSKQIRDEYVAHAGKMFELLGDDATQSAAEAKTVMHIETRLAQASLTPVQRRDPQALYHKMDLAQLKAITPAFDWESYFEEVGHPHMGAINVDVPAFFKEVNQALTGVSLADWKTYLRWRLIDRAAPDLSSPFVAENFNFKGHILTGSKENLPQWQRCVAATDRGLGEALGQVYVKDYFPPAAKVRAEKMVANLIAALRSDISTLSWMGPETRKAAIAKLAAIMQKIGNPSKWRDYSALMVNRGLFVENAFRANQFEFHREINKIGKPVDRTEWDMTPPTVNAYYDPSMNEIVFPAGILQPPFFNAKADDAVNYGAMGAVIGHEMTHGFDDEGRQFDAKGNMINWWTPEDLKRFQARAQCVVRQFDGFVVGDSLHENGKLVLGESIADLGGLTIAYAAYQKSLEGKTLPPDIGGFTPDQRFFLSYAQIWAENIRPQFARLLVSADPHPIPKFRVLGPLSNMPAFAKAFDCKPGDPMVRPAGQRCQIW